MLFPTLNMEPVVLNMSMVVTEVVNLWESTTDISEVARTSQLSHKSWLDWHIKR